MHLYYRRHFKALIAVASCCCLLIIIHCTCSIPTSGEYDQHPVSTLHQSDSTQVFKYVEMFPPLGKDESPNDIDFNIDRTFATKGWKHITQTVPKIIHFIWNNQTVPSQFVDNLRSFLKNNEGWQYHFWTLNDGRSLIQKHHPELVQTYDNYTQDVIRADVLRYVVMYHFGGAYFDLDTWSLKPLDTVIVGEQCVVSPEPMEHAVFVLNMRSLLSNAVFLCSPKHTFFKFLIDGLPEASSEPSEQLQSGPIYYTRIFNRYITYCSNSNLNKPVSETIHVVSYSVFLDRIKDDVHVVLEHQCPNLDHSTKVLYEEFSCHRQTYKHAVEMCQSFLFDRCRIEACERWLRRGCAKRTVSPLAVNDHMYYGTYARPQSITYARDNHITNVIPDVMLHSDTGY